MPYFTSHLFASGLAPRGFLPGRLATKSAKSRKKEPVFLRLLCFFVAMIFRRFVLDRTPSKCPTKSGVNRQTRIIAAGVHCPG